MVEDWSWPRLGSEPPDPAAGLRERKKLMTRQQLSDTATAMFLERGFDAVKVSEVAAACGVSEKTVYNYFPTKESLLLDREDAMTAYVRAAIARTGVSPVEAVVGVLGDDLDQMTEWFDAQRHPAKAISMIRRFGDLVESTASLRAHQRDMMERLVAVAAEAMAERAGVSPEEPEPQIAADALVGLWRIQFRALRRLADGTRTPGEVRDLVTAEVRRAARLADSGLWSFGIAVQGWRGEDAAAAAASAERARRQVRSAIAEAKRTWRAVREPAREREAAERSRRRPRS